MWWSIDCFVLCNDYTMQRFYVTFPLTIDLTLTDSDIVYQLTRVMRAEIGDEILLFDGDGSETIYEIQAVTKKSLTLRGKGRKFPKTESVTQITLYQAMPNKLEKLEYILQKWVEVGIRKFVFFRSDFSQKLILSDAKKARLTTIAREALEQCGGLVMPSISFIDGVSAFRHSEAWRIQDFRGTEHRSFVPQDDERVHIVLDTTGISLKIQEIPKKCEIGIWVGPEGWWSEKERIEMRKNGFIFARFWERVLRTETAGVVMAFALLHA